MISFEDAKKAALKLDKFDCAFDYGDAFVFGYKQSTSFGDVAIAVYKKTGKGILFPEYLANRTEHTRPKALPM